MRRDTFHLRALFLLICVVCVSVRAGAAEDAVTVRWVNQGGVRVEVARGSIAYSAVIQPSPLPFRHPGTPDSTDAVQSTRVSPNDTRHEPSA